MARADLLSILYSKEKSPLEFKFDSMWIPSIYNFLTPYDIQELHSLASSARLSSKIEYKYKEIDRILRARGFRKFHCGTNRIVYSYLEDQSFLIKIALDKVGLGDNPAEYRNQFILKPFVTKVFEVTPCGTVATVERVEPITSRQEFISVAEDIFDLMNQCIIGKYVLEDVGTNYFMNWGLRKGFGAVLLDYTYVYELDGNKLFCNKVDPMNGEICNGMIDYDSGFNNLICSKCGKRYFAKALEQSVKDQLIILKDEGEIEMKVQLQRGKEIVATFYSEDESDVIVRKQKKNNYVPDMEVYIDRGDNTVQQIMEEKEQVRAGYTNKEVSSNKQESVSVSIDTDEIQVEQKPVYKEEVSIKVEGDNREEVESTVSDIVSSVKESNKELIEKKVKYTRDLVLDDKENEQLDMLEKLGLSDKDFEEPKEEIVSVQVKEEKITSIKVKEEDKKDPMAKYYEEYSEEEDSFQRIKKSNKKNIMDNY